MSRTHLIIFESRPFTTCPALFQNNRNMETKNSSLSPQLQRALHAIEAATAEMTEEQLTWHPEGKWSSTLILEHLSLAFSSTVRGMKRALEAGKPDVRKP